MGGVERAGRGRVQRGAGARARRRRALLRRAARAAHAPRPGRHRHYVSNL